MLETSRNIVLIGFMATGKTTVGRELAARLRRKLVDTDEEIERRTGKAISQIFSQYGEGYFREIESAVVREVAAQQNLVITTGGGVVLRPENVKALKENGVLILLKAPPEVIYQRICVKNGRPLLEGHRDVLKRIKELLAERKDAYNVAEFVVDTGRFSVEEAAKLILNYLKNYREPR